MSKTPARLRRRARKAQNQKSLGNTLTRWLYGNGKTQTSRQGNWTVRYPLNPPQHFVARDAWYERFKEQLA